MILCFFSLLIGNVQHLFCSIQLLTLGLFFFHSSSVRSTSSHMWPNAAWTSAKRGVCVWTLHITDAAACCLASCSVSMATRAAERHEIPPTPSSLYIPGYVIIRVLQRSSFLLQHTQICKEETAGALALVGKKIKINSFPSYKCTLETLPVKRDKWQSH